jgi:hypothetical protein
MIPQLREAATKYELDGAWVDGECWATGPDYGKAAEEKFGSPLPRKAGEPRWAEFLDFNRAQFRRYARHYLDELHRSHPNFQIASNWLYTTYVPEKPELPVDFISGDYLGNASMETARLEARYLSSVGKPWDLMAWGFQSAGTNSSLGHIHKNAEHLMQEASVVLAQGGGFQVYYTPTRTGYFDDKLIGTMAAVAKFCRDRQEVCHKTETVPMAGILFSKHSLYNTSNKMFGGWSGQLTGPARGVLGAMLESHYPVDVLPEWKAAEVAGAYKLIVVPDWKDIGAEMKALMVNYAESGGNLLLIGAENARIFGEVLGVKLRGEPANQACWIAGSDIVGNVRGLWQDFEPAGAEVLEQRYPSTDLTREAKPAATVQRIGKGQIAAIYGPIGSVFAQSHAPATRQFLQRVTERIWSPAIRVEAPPTVEIAIRKKAGRTIVHLNNATNMQVAGDYATTDFIPTVGPVRLEIELAKAPVRVRLAPGGTLVKGTWQKGVWKGEVPSVTIHSALVFEN